MVDTLTGITQFLELLAAAIAALGTVLAGLALISRPIREWIAKKIATKSNITDKMSALEAKVENRMVDMTAQITRLTELVEETKNQNESQNKDMELIKNATLASTRNTLTYLSRKAREKGSVTSNDRENYDKMYQAYTALGGNSYVHRLYDEYMMMEVDD